MKPSQALGPMARAGPATSGAQLEILFPARPKAVPSTTLSVGILSTYPSMQSAVDLFTESLAQTLADRAPGTSVRVVQMLSARFRSRPLADGDAPPPGVAADSREAAHELNMFDVVVIPYEQGDDVEAHGERLLELADQLVVPVVLVVRAVLSKPTTHQRHVLATLAASADAVVAMSRGAHLRLFEGYGAQLHKLMLIAHGAPVPEVSGRMADRTRRPTILTWGLLGPGKGIEWGIDAVAAMNLLRPRPRYVVAGPAHPRWSAGEGDAYREFLTRRAQDRGVAHLVEFEPTFADPPRLRRLLDEADVVLLPYDSHEQVTSGVLTEALAAAVPVVATRFPHAVELLADGHGGTLVSQQDPAAIAVVLIRIIIQPGVATAMSAHNARFAAQLGWPAVADKYRQVLDAVARRPPAPSR